MSPVFYLYDGMSPLTEASENDYDKSAKIDEMPAEGMNNTPYTGMSAYDLRNFMQVHVGKEFPDGFKWVYPVESTGEHAGGFHSTVTEHTGIKYIRAYNGDWLWELRGPDNRAYIDIVIDNDGNAIMSESPSNMPNMYKSKILPYVKWFMENKLHSMKTELDVCVFDFLKTDPSFVDYVVDNLPDMLGDTDQKILFWKGAIANRILSEDDLKRVFSEGLSLDTMLKEMPRLAQYLTDTNYNSKNRSILGQYPFTVLCYACGHCPYSMAEVRRLISAGKIRLFDFLRLDPDMLDPSIQRAFVRADPNNMKLLSDIARYHGSFHVSRDTFEDLLERLETPRTNENIREWTYAVDQLISYILYAEPKKSARNVLEEMLDDKLIMENILPYLCSLAKVNPYGREASRMVELINRFPDVELPSDIYYAIANSLFGENAIPCSNAIKHSILKMPKNQLDLVIQGRPAKDLIKFALDDCHHKYIDGRNVVSSAKNICRVASMYPSQEMDDAIKALPPALCIACMCVRPDYEDNRAQSVRFVANRILNEDKKWNYNRNAMLPAYPAVCMYALGQFPEIMQLVSPKDVLEYVCRHADSISHSGPCGCLSVQLVDILEEAFRSLPSDKDKSNMSDDLATVLLAACNDISYPKPGDPIYNELFYHTMSNVTVDNLCWSWRIYPDIPYEEWDRYAEHIGKSRFIRHYIVASMNNRDRSSDEHLYEYMAGWILSPETAPAQLPAVINEREFRKKPILAKMKEVISERVESGTDIDAGKASTLQAYGLLSADLLRKVTVADFDRNKEENIEAVNDKKIDFMLNHDELKVFSKARAFPEYVSNLYRAIIEYYDMAIQPHKHAERPGFVMYCRFMKLTDFMLKNAKLPGVIAAAKLILHNGILDAYRIVAGRCGENGQLIHMANGNDVSGIFSEYIEKLAELGRTRQKYKAGDMELPLKERK